MASNDEAGGYRGRLGEDGRVCMFACCMSAWLPQTCSYWLCEVRALFGVDVYCCWWMHGIGPVR